MLTVLFIGDIFGKPGRLAVESYLPELKREYSPDLIIANGENLTHGGGMNLASYNQMREAGIELFTSGNHIFDMAPGVELLKDPSERVLRPANYPDEVPGRGVEVIDVNGTHIRIVSLAGQVFMKDEVRSPFEELDRILGEQTVAVTIVDLHAEATSEKACMAFDFDGKISALLGTHTHVATADARILPEGTAFQSDVGMTGPLNSSLGIDSDEVIRSFRENKPFRKKVAEGPVLFSAALLKVDEKTGHSTEIIPLSKVLDLGL